MILAPQLFPPIAWWVQLVRAHEQGQPVRIGTGLPFRKQAGLNHYRIKGPNSLLLLTAQVARASWGQPLPQAELSFAEPWQRQHARSLATAYRNAPFWAEFAPPFLALLHQPPTRLWDLQWAALQQLCQDLRLPLPQPDPTLAPPPDLTPAPILPYYQLHGPFAADLSILDLLLHEGPRAPLFLHRMVAS